MSKTGKESNKVYAGYFYPEGFWDFCQIVFCGSLSALHKGKVLRE